MPSLPHRSLRFSLLPFALLACLGAAVALFVPPVRAQSHPALGSGAASFLLPNAQSLAIEVLDPSPEPGKRVRLRLRSNNYRIPIERATVRWLVDGEEVGSGVSRLEQEVVLPDRVGEVTLAAEATLPDGRILTARRTLPLAKIVLVWEGTGYTFPTYAGRARAVKQGSVAAHAFAIVEEDGKRLPPEQLLFRWKVVGTSLPSQKGLGLASVRFASGRFGIPYTIYVEVVTPRGRSFTKSVTIRPRKPHLLFYERHPLLGIRYDRFLNPLVTTRDRLEIVAEPMYFRAESRTDPNLVYEWEHNGAFTKVKGPALSLQAQSEDRPIRASLALTVWHRKSVQQEEHTTYEAVFARRR